jgi:YD repeat-containing protein
MRRSSEHVGGFLVLRSVRFVFIGVLCCTVAIASVAVGMSSGRAARSGLEASEGVSSILLSGSLSSRGQTWLDEGRQGRAERIARLADPEAIRTRILSRTAYRHLGPHAAAQLAGLVFPTVVEPAAGGVPSLPAGERVVRYLSQNAASVSLPGKRHAVIESLAPMARQTGRRTFTPIDMGLAYAGGSYVAKSSPAAVRIPKHLNDGVSLPVSGVSFTPVDNYGRALSGSNGAVEGASVVYANTQADTDTLVKPTTDGVEFSSILRSASSPSKLWFHVGLPGGAKLRKDDSTGVVSVVRDGGTLATIAAPSAQDAAEESIPVSLRVSGDRVAVVVALPSKGPQYPVAVDPNVSDEELTGHTHPTRWKFCSSTGNPYCSGIWSVPFESTGWGGTSGLTLHNLGEYFAGQWASLNYQTQGESKINQVTGKASGSNASGNIDVYAQVVDGKESENPALWVIEGSQIVSAPPATSYSNVAMSVCGLLGGVPNCSVGSGAKKNLFRFEISASGEGVFDENTINNAAVSISQSNNPTVKFNTTSPTVGGRTNVLYGSGAWLGPYSGAYEVEAKDPGIGVNYLAVSSGLWLAKHPFFEESRCEGVQCFPEVKETYTYNEKLKDGEDTFEITATNAMAGSTVTTTSKIKVDSTVPTTVNLIGLPANKELSEQPYAVKAEATDGSGSLESSGIKSIVLGIDGNEVIPKTTGSCSPGPCTAKAEWLISAEGLGGGEHLLTVAATDNAGNVATKNYEIFAHQATHTAVGPGAVNPITGEFSMSATDVSISGGSGNLGISRTYRSRHVTAGTDGPLGGQWTLSTGPVQKVEKLLSGGVVLFGADGGTTSFPSNGSGGFTSPAGDKNLAMSEIKEGEKTKEFILNNSTAGTKTHFTLPEGATEGPWMPHIAEGVVATGTETYKFNTVEVEGQKITEPTEMLAPVPAGVSCSPTLTKGCRALTFNYAASSTAGESPGSWGDYKGHLTRVYFTAWDPKSGKMSAPVEIAKYAYDGQGRLRAEWDPRISPALKTIYGYDAAGHVTAVQQPGQQPWLLAYGSNAGDTNSGRLVSVSRPPASTTLGEGVAPASTAVPTLSTSSPTLGKAVSVTNGTWNNAPLGYSYQWQRCGSGGSNCVQIYGARNQSYTPVLADGGYTLVAQVTAVNAGGSVTSSTSASAAVASTTPTSTIQFGAVGTGNGQFKAPATAAFDSSGNIWVADTSNDRIQKFSPAGVFVAAYGTTGTGNLQFKGPWGIAIDQKSGNAFVSDQSNCRIEELNAAAEYVRAFGTCGSGPGQLNGPSGVALDPEGNVWVADMTNNRLEEFNSTGAYMRTVGAVGSGNGQLKSPRAIVFSGSNMYVTDSGNNRVEEFSSEGTYVTQFGAAGSGNGQFSTPMGIASDPLSGDIYVVDDNNNRVQVFNPAGTYVSKFGAVGTGAGQFKNPLGVAVNQTGTVIVLDSGNNRVSQWWPTPAQTYSAAIGSTGSGNGQLSKPIDEAVDPMGNIWVTDSSNNRIEKFSPYGAFLGASGSFGAGHGQFNSPGGIAINQATGNIYVADQKNSRIEEFSPSGVYITEFGKAGNGSGEFSNPYGVEVDSNGNIWVADMLNGRVQEFSQTGTTFSVVRIVGKKGTGNGEFVEPLYMTLTGGNLYVTDWGNNRVQEFNASTGEYIRQFGTKGTGNGQFEGPEGIAADPATGTVYVSDTGKNRVETFSANGVFLTTFGSVGTGEGQFKFPVGLAFNSSGVLYMDDYGNNRIVKGTAGNVDTEAPAPPTVGTTAVETIEYNVPVQGAGAPYAMGSADVAAWGQEDNPSEAMAIFPPDEVQTTPASDYRRATISYLDEEGHTVNVASPGGAITTTEYDFNNGVVRTLSPSNRAIALGQGTKSIEVSEQLDAETVYNADDTNITETLGPEHLVKLSSGAEVQARERSRYFYDEGAPGGGQYNLVTKVTSGAQYSGGEADINTRIESYSGQSDLGWTLRKPTSITTDPSGLKLTQTTIYDSTNGRPIETRAPAAGPANGPAGGYAYTAEVNTVSVAAKKQAGVAIDSSGNVWQVETEANRVDEYTSTGGFVRTFGSEGTGNVQFKKPQGIAVDASGNVWVTDTGNNRVEELSSTGTFIKAFGTAGEEAGKFKEPMGIAIDSGGNVWVGDRGNNRIEKFNSAGVLQQIVGKLGFGNGEFVTNFGSLYSMWLMFDSAGHLWVTDGGNNRVQEFSAAGTYMTKFGGEFGAPSSENGKFSSPAGIAHDASGNIFVVDSGNSRVEKFSSTGTYVAKFGASGTGNVQFKTPAGIALDSVGDIWVGDTANNRLEEVNSAFSWIRNVTSVTVATKKPVGVAIDSSGNVWQVESEANRVDEYSSTGGFVRTFGSEGTGNVQFKKPQGIAVDASGNVWVTDTGNNRVEELSSTGTFIKAFGTGGEEAGKFKEPMGIAIDSSGNVWVGDRGNNRVEKFNSAGTYQQTVGKFGFGNGEFFTNAGGSLYPMWLMFDSAGHLWVTDGGWHRVQEFSSAGTYMAKFGNESGLPSSENGKFNSPAGISHDSSGNIWVVDSGNNRVEEFSSLGTYIAKLGQNGTSQGQFKAPTGIAVSSSGYVWVGDTSNNRTQQFGVASADPRVTQTIYYSSSANAAYPECGEHPEWANMVCRTQPAIQPVASVAPKIPIVTMKYSMWGALEETVETVGSTTRTKKSTFDSAGRVLTSAVTSSVGTAIPTVTNEYNSTTGALVKMSTTVSEKTQAVTETYNTLGQLTSYQDADGNTSTYKYNLDDEVEEVNDGKGTQSYTYDATTGALTKLADTAAGTFSAERDVEGRLTAEIYPNGMTARYSYDAGGTATSVEYVKTTHCSENCIWYKQSVVSGIRGEMLSQANTLATNAYVYDAAGRLTQADETPAGGGCKRRLYVYDTESNRTSTTLREPGAEGQCATSGGTVESHTYDEANRLIDAETVYDTYGDITFLPAVDAGGNSVTSSFYSSSQLRSQTQNGLTLTYNLDPIGRARETISSGTKTSDVISHYAGTQSAPSWTSELGEKWSRNIVGMAGELVAVQTNGESPILQVHDLQGDIVGTASESETETKLLSTYNSTEFGVPSTSNPPKYSWGGAGGIATEMASGISNSDTSSYVPQLARPLQSEPIAPPGRFPNGSDTGAPYVSGMEPWVGQSDAAWGAGVIDREAARQAAAARAALEAAFQYADIDPVVYYDYVEAERVAAGARGLSKLGDMADFVADIPDFLVGHFIDIIEGQIFAKVNGVDALKKWFEVTATALEACAKDIVVNGKYEMAHGACRYAYHHFALKFDLGFIHFKFELINPFWMAHVSWCPLHHKNCIKITP